MLSSKTSRWTATTALLCAAIMAATWLLLISPRRAEAADIRAQAEERQSQNDALQLEVAQLRAQFAELGKSRAELAQIQAQMPINAAMPALVRSVDAAATASGVDLVSLTPAAAKTMTQRQGAASTPAPSAGTGAPASPAAGSAGGLRVIELPVTIVSHGEYFQQVLFLKKLQTELVRVLAISNLQMAVQEATDAEDSTTGVVMTVTGRVFALPDAAATAPTTTSGTSGSSGTTGTSGTTGSTGTTTPASGTDASSTTQTAALSAGPATRVGEQS